MEKNILAMRFSFLRQYQAMLTFPLHRHIVFLDETWILSTENPTKPRLLENQRDMAGNVAGTTNSFIPHANLIFASKLSTSDYHGEINSDLQTQLRHN
ncbi:hypothetical protein QE152_g27434 [Popillia japonica]|uniref:Uncharacterized protein n=1 Tax=Popillia japonica TaxID=7064 RepID=A0AAW1JUL8_POPJA